LDPKILDDVIKENQLDAICGLTMGPAYSIDNIYGVVGRCFFLTTPAATKLDCSTLIQCLTERSLITNNYQLIVFIFLLVNYILIIYSFNLRAKHHH
jgi:hypothetical protein